MAKIVKRIKKLSQRLKSISSKTKKALGKTVRLTRKKRVTRSLADSRDQFAKLKVEGKLSLRVEEAKYFTHPENRITQGLPSQELGGRYPERIALPVPLKEGAYSEKEDLPLKYEKDVIVLQVRDPWWLHAYWEVCEKTYQRLKNELSRLFESAKKILRIYDVSFINFNGSNAHRYFDIELNHNAQSWYIDTGGPGRSWCVDLGLRLSDGRFITIVRSNIVTTPLDGPSWVSDEEWAVPEELFARLYTSAVGLGGSPVKLKKPWEEFKMRSFASGGISSIGFSPGRKQEGERSRKFWLVVNTELIVYGATEPDAKVTVAGRAIALRPDGTFSLRFSLPDGKQVLPVKATSPDGIDERIITPVVTKETK